MENKEMDTCKLLYNTERVKLYIPEYGRNVQKMVDYIKTIEDRDKRNEQARAVIKVMEILNPAVHLQEDFEHKLWDHLFIISGFDLDVDAPYPMPAPESLNEQPLPVPIQKKPVKAAHYGRNIENMLELIAEHEDGEAKNAMMRTLAGYMKQQYLIWNKDTVADETIYKDMEMLSGGRITVPESLKEGKLEFSHGFSRQNGNGHGRKNGNFKQKGNQKNRNKQYK
ncbi:MAG: DUF4290 domain-containing protein [Bacteroidales bacterium]|nr:DUF4290 domain-containing protein [Bacteroidales bacterium]